MSVIRTIPAGYRGPHVLADYLFTRPCPGCGGTGEEKYFPGELLRAEREAAWGRRSLRRMSRELGIPLTTLGEKERGFRGSYFTEDEARRYLTALGIL